MSLRASNYIHLYILLQYKLLISNVARAGGQAPWAHWMVAHIHSSC